MRKDRLNDQEILQEKFWNNKLMELIDIDEQVMSQKAKSNWIKLGDGNNAFFHATVKCRRIGMRIYQLHREDNTREI